MNYHDWAKNASPYANTMGTEITCSTCIECNTEYQRDDNKYQFNPLRCPFCMGMHGMRGQYANTHHYNMGMENCVRHNEKVGTPFTNIFGLPQLF